jgi:hypothetical protein
MTNGRGDRTRETPRCHRGLEPRRDDWSLGLAIFIRASGHAYWLHKQAVYMTAPWTAVVTPSKHLPTGGRPYMTLLSLAECLGADDERKSALKAGHDKKDRNRRYAAKAGRGRK